MRRIVLVLTVGAMMAALLMFSSPSAMAQDFDLDGFFFCDNDDDDFDGFIECEDLFGDGSFIGFGDGVTLDTSNEAESGEVSISYSVS